MSPAWRECAPPVTGGLVIHSLRASRIALPVGFALLLVAAGCTLPTGEPATPQRPTFSFSPATTAAGTWEVEAGMVVDPGDTREAPTTWKYGLDEHTEVSIAASPYIKASGNSGFGDMGLGWRHRLVDAEGSKPAFAVLATAKIPTADEDRGLGTGETDAFAGATLGGSLGRFGWVAFGELGALGADLARDLALVASWVLDERNSLFAELSDRNVHETDTHSAQLRVGTYFAVRPDFVLDWAVYFPMSDDAPDTSFAVGFTRNLGR